MCSEPETFIIVPRQCAEHGTHVDCGGPPSSVDGTLALPGGTALGRLAALAIATGILSRSSSLLWMVSIAPGVDGGATVHEQEPGDAVRS